MESVENKSTYSINLCQFSVLLTVLAGISIITSALHFWPFENKKIWQIFNIPNLCCATGLLAMVVFLIKNKGHWHGTILMPHISILAYLAINILSIGFADDLSRSLHYTVKLVMVFLGGFFLFQNALSKPKVLSFFYTLITATVSLSILVCIYTRLADSPAQFGFHDNVFKYGTYIGILVPLCCVYLLIGSKLQSFIGILIATTASFSLGSAGGCLAIFTGLITGLFLVKKRSVKVKILACILLSVVALTLSNRIFDNTIEKDFTLKENDRINLKQRYIEWQAEINLIEKRSITGTGAGCINDYRSSCYYRLPKLNTLKPFEQNGFLAVAAETGMFGLLTLIWMLIYYGRMSLRDSICLQIHEEFMAFRFSVANTAAFISMLIANIFSSVHYNGILIVFVLLISLISSVNKNYGEYISEV